MVNERKHIFFFFLFASQLQWWIRTMHRLHTRSASPPFFATQKLEIFLGYGKKNVFILLNIIEKGDISLLFLLVLLLFFSMLVYTVGF